jgi:ribosome maturation factor RimP
MSLEDTLQGELKRIAEPLGLTVIEVKTYRGKKELQIHVVIDKYNGVSIADCEKVTRLFGERIDVLEVVDAGQ